MHAEATGGKIPCPVEYQYLVPVKVSQRQIQLVVYFCGDCASLHMRMPANATTLSVRIRHRSDLLE